MYLYILHRGARTCSRLGGWHLGLRAQLVVKLEVSAGALEPGALVLLSACLLSCLLSPVPAEADLALTYCTTVQDKTDGAPIPAAV